MPEQLPSWVPRYASVVEAVGIDPRPLDLMDLYLLYGAIMHHPLAQSCRLKETTWEVCPERIRQLPDRDRLVIREAVTGVVPIHQGKSA